MKDNMNKDTYLPVIENTCGVWSTFANKYNNFNVDNPQDVCDLLIAIKELAIAIDANLQRIETTGGAVDYEQCLGQFISREPLNYDPAKLSVLGQFVQNQIKYAANEKLQMTCDLTYSFVTKIYRLNSESEEIQNEAFKHQEAIDLFKQHLIDIDVYSFDNLMSQIEAATDYNETIQLINEIFGTGLFGFFYRCLIQDETESLDAIFAKLRSFYSIDDELPCDKENDFISWHNFKAELVRYDADAYLKKVININSLNELIDEINKIWSDESQGNGELYKLVKEANNADGCIYNQYEKLYQDSMPGEIVDGFIQAYEKWREAKEKVENTFCQAIDGIKSAEELKDLNMNLNKIWEKESDFNQYVSFIDSGHIELIINKFLEHIDSYDQIKNQLYFPRFRDKSFNDFIKFDDKSQNNVKNYLDRLQIKEIENSINTFNNLVQAVSSASDQCIEQLNDLHSSIWNTSGILSYMNVISVDSYDKLMKSYDRLDHKKVHLSAKINHQGLPNKEENPNQENGPDLICQLERKKHKLYLLLTKSYKKIFQTEENKNHLRNAVCDVRYAATKHENTEKLNDFKKKYKARGGLFKLANKIRSVDCKGKKNFQPKTIQEIEKIEKAEREFTQFKQT